MDKEIKFFVKRIFVKDISFESPEAPGIFGNIKSSPKIGFNLDDKIEKIDDTSYEITLDITVKAEIEDKILYLAEIKQSGIFGIEGVTDDLLDGFLHIRCPEVIFPYARETISSLIQKAGFPPLFLSPIDFNALYQLEKSRKNKNYKAPNITDLEKELSDKLGLKTSIQFNENGSSGSLTLYYSDLNQLDDLMKRLKK